MAKEGSTCVRFATCAFFNNKMRTMPSTAAMTQYRYCKGDFESCARYQVSLVLPAVPEDLAPSDHEGAARLMNKKS